MKNNYRLLKKEMDFVFKYLTIQDIEHVYLWLDTLEQIYIDIFIKENVKSNILELALSGDCIFVLPRNAGKQECYIKLDKELIFNYDKLISKIENIKCLV